jgi:hypothetical protein
MEEDMRLLDIETKNSGIEALNEEKEIPFVMAIETNFIR